MQKSLIWSSKTLSLRKLFWNVVLHVAQFFFLNFTSFDGAESRSKWTRSGVSNLLVKRPQDQIFSENIAVTSDQFILKEKWKVFIWEIAHDYMNSIFAELTPSVQLIWEKTSFSRNIATLGVSSAKSNSCKSWAISSNENFFIFLLVWIDLK